MTARATLGGVSPLFVVDDIDASVSFYCDCLGFELRHISPPEEPFFAIVGRDGAQIMLKVIGPDIGPMPNSHRHEWARWDASVYVEDPDTLAHEFEGRRVSFREPLSDTDDGLRGFELEDAHGYVLFFGRPQR